MTASRFAGMTLAEIRCAKDGFCVFILGAAYCTMCGRDRNGERRTQ